MKTIQTALFSLLTVLALSSAQATEVYKWVDENGIVHYSEKAPQDRPVEVITTRTRPSSATPPPAKTVKAEKKEEKTTQAAAPQVVKKDAASCKRARKALQTLISKPIVRQGGKVMTIDEKNQAIKNQKEIISVHCP